MTKPILKFENVNYFIGQTQILNDINFELNKGDFLSIIGANGSGKTTLLKLILKIKESQSGKITLNNSTENINIGYVPQAKTLDLSFPAIALELVANGINRNWSFRISQKQKEQSLETLKKINAEHLAMKQLSDLSGGELQRIYLARAIIKNPEILLLDELATGIDMVCENDVNSIIKKLNAELKTTIIMVTHDLDSAYNQANKLLLLNKKVIYFGETCSGFTDENILKTFTNLRNNNHKFNFGIKNINE
jgi:zinc transport system ATP-binding protein